MSEEEMVIEYFYCDVCKTGRQPHEVDEERDDQAGISVYRCPNCGEELEKTVEPYTFERANYLSAVFGW